MRRIPALSQHHRLLASLFIYFLIFCLNANASPLGIPIQDVNGKVVDQSGQPIPGASIKIKGKKGGAITHPDGSFTLTAEANDVLEITAIGFQRTEVTVGSKTPLQITLSASIGAMNEVVVVGYGTQKKVNITGAVSSIKMEKINDIPVTNVSNALAGRAAGVTVINTSGFAGATSSISVRGAFGEPLYVIDGILKDKSTFDAMDPNEIDQMSILKDAATAAVYGAQAGNGVVVITTKKGIIQKPVFSFQVSNTVSTPTQTLLSNMTNATDELTYQNRVAQFNAEQAHTPYTAPNNSEVFDYFKNKSYNVSDWIWRNPSNQKYLLSIRGGSDKISYYSMLSYTNEKGSYVNLDYGKFNLRSDVTAKISDAVSLDLNIAAAQQSHDRFYWPFEGDDDYNVGDFYRVTFNWPKLYPFYLEKDGTPANHITPYPVQTPMGSWQAWNVIDQVEGDRYIHTRRRQLNSTLTLNVKLDQFIKGLSAKFVGNYEANDFYRKWFLTFQKNYVFIPADPSGNQYIPGPPDPNQTNTFTFGQNLPMLSYNIATGSKYQLDGYLNYDRKFGQHSVNAMVVFEQSEIRGYGSTATGYSPVSNIDQMFSYSSSSGNRYGDANEAREAYQSLIGRVNYNFADRYIADFSFRDDGNYSFAPDSRWGFFPSGSLAWRVSQEPFFKDAVRWVDELKLRASYGSTGNIVDVNNDKISPFLYGTSYGNSGGYMLGNTYYTAIRPGQTPNPNITWATIHETNFGLDFAMLQNRLSGSADVFVKKMENILGPRTVTLPASYGQSLAPENYAARSFRGTDLSLQWQDRIGKISYSIYGNIGYAKDRWDILDQLAIYNPGGQQSFYNAIGQPSNRLFGFKADGIIRTQAELDALIAKGYNYYGRQPYLGAILYKDIRGQNFSTTPDGKIDDNDIELLSNNGKPRINFGVGFNVGWKGFSLDMLFQGVSAYDKMISNLEGGGIRQWGGNFRTYYPIWAGDVWTPENTNAKYPRPVGQNWLESGTGASSFWMRNGAYLRLRNINLTYNLPGKWVERIGLSGTQLFFNGTNLFTFSKMKEFQDPEQLNYDSYPVMKSFTTGINVKF
ncbi:TonB-dependent receptor [Chitinophaga sp. MM2321]|uniref:SusC/RagA family TonB-linked outer membrane protein n=1 Tax=Chitinophaga sp. MM2321 TaxID=3137178 RepID=UPI0032D5A675